MKPYTYWINFPELIKGDYIGARWEEYRKNKSINQSPNH